jgi:hypothetical protein
MVKLFLNGISYRLSKSGKACRMIRVIRYGGYNQAFFMPEEYVYNLLILKVLAAGEIEVVKNCPEMS